MGFFSAVAGIFTMYEMLYFWPTQGSGLMLTTLTAVYVGGTSLFGGKGTIFGTFIGVLIIGSLESGIIVLGLSGFYIQFINVLMITSVVTIYALIQKKRLKDFIFSSTVIFLFFYFGNSLRKSLVFISY